MHMWQNPWKFLFIFSSRCHGRKLCSVMTFHIEVCIWCILYPITSSSCIVSSIKGISGDSLWQNLDDAIISFLSRPTSEFPHPLSRVKQPAGYRVSQLKYCTGCLLSCWPSDWFYFFDDILSCHIKLLIHWFGLGYGTWLMIFGRRS